jgi:hypothetical protein
MGSRIELGEVLFSILGTASVYFQPPENIKIVYPCIVYELDRLDTIFSNDFPYIHKKRYQITVIDKDPDSVIPHNIAQLKQCIFSNKYKNDNLYHYVFNIYF